MDYELARKPPPKEMKNKRGIKNAWKLERGDRGEAQLIPIGNSGEHRFSTGQVQRGRTSPDDPEAHWDGESFACR